MDFTLLHPADQIVMIMDRIYRNGMTTTSGGNLSILDDNGDIWISPGGIDKGTLTRRDIMCVKPDGTAVGHHKPSIEFPFHKRVYEIRKDVRAVLHAHPPALVAFSIARVIPHTRLLPKSHLVCGNVGMAPYDLPGSMRLGDKIASEFERGFNLVMLENHGVVVADKNLFEAFKAFETLDFTARIEINARRIGSPFVLREEALEKFENALGEEMQEFTPHGRSSRENEARREMCGLVHRAYDQQLFTSTQGTFSVRLDAETFLITPYDTDRKYLELGDPVLIRNGRREAGKVPSQSVSLHEAIYRKQPHVEAVIIAHAPNIMAFAVTEAAFDSRTIPESYIMLRNVPKIPFAASVLQPELTADLFIPSVPVAIVENDAVIVTGSSLLNAFDRLEVAEYSAKGIIDSRMIGEMVAINDEQVEEIVEAFMLPRG